MENIRFGLFDPQYILLGNYVLPKTHSCAGLVAATLVDYVGKGGVEAASELVRARYKHHVQQHDFSTEEFARAELGNALAVLGNSTPCALWVLHHIFSDKQVLADIRRELLSLVHDEQSARNGKISSIDLASTRTSCPVLTSTFQKTMRYRAVAPGPRVLLDDDFAGCAIIAQERQHVHDPKTDTSAWGEDAGVFDHMRFVREPGRKRPNRVAFRACGGVHVLCPGRHFASTEIMALAALLVLQFDVVPMFAGEWVEPTWENSPHQAGFPIIDKDIEVELRPSHPGTKWNVIFTGSDEIMEMVMEDAVSVKKD